MTDDEIKDKLLGVKNRCIILMFLLDQTPLPKSVIDALPTLYEDNCQFTQDMVFDRCVVW